MSPSNLLEMAIIAFIVFGIAFLGWRGGVRNPVGTGGLDKKLSGFGSDLTAIKASIDGELAAVKGKVGQIEQRLNTFEEAVASGADIKRLERSIDKLAKILPDIEARQRVQSDKTAEEGKVLAATAAKVDHIDKQISLMMSVVVPKGMGR